MNVSLEADCPFCAYDQVFIREDLTEDGEEYFFQCECSNCGAKGPPSFEDRGGAIRKWNKQNIVVKKNETIKALTTELTQIKGVCNVANLAMIEYDNFPGATTRQAMVDSMWRLRQALRQAGFEYINDTLDWRGSILNELNDAGFYPSTNDPYHATKPDFVYDPTAPKNKRIFGNAVGSTLKEIVAELATTKRERDAARTEVDQLREAQRWIPVSEKLPSERRCYLWMTTMSNQPTVSFYDPEWNTASAATHWMELPKPPAQDGKP